MAPAARICAMAAASKPASFMFSTLSPLTHEGGIFGRTLSESREGRSRVLMSAHRPPLNSGMRMSLSQSCWSVGMSLASLQHRRRFLSRRVRAISSEIPCREARSVLASASTRSPFLAKRASSIRFSPDRDTEWMPATSLFIQDGENGHRGVAALVVIRERIECDFARRTVGESCAAKASLRIVIKA